MVFFLIGLGLGDPRDVTVRGLEVIRGCERIYLEAYTSILSGGREALVRRAGMTRGVSDVGIDMMTLIALDFFSPPKKNKIK